MTRKARLLVFVVALILLLWTIYEQAYQVSSIVGLCLILLIWSHFKQGTVMLAAKVFHEKDYEKAEELLKEVKDPDRLSRKRRGFYEFMYGNIELQRENYEASEHHFQIASRFPLRNENDKAIVLVHLANLNLRKQNYEKVRAYTEKAKELKISARIENIIQKIEQELKGKK